MIQKWDNGFTIDFYANDSHSFLYSTATSLKEAKEKAEQFLLKELQSVKKNVDRIIKQKGK